MEHWNYVSGEKGSVSSETIPPSDSCAGNKSSLANWDLKGPYSFGSNMLFTGHQSIENHAFGDLVYGELVGKQVENDSTGKGLSGKISGGKSVIMGTPNAFFGEDESSSKLSHSVVESNSRDFSLIDLKLGDFPDQRERPISYFPKAPILSSSESSTPPKRVRATGINSHTAYCQVYGCNKDLSSSKDYHKRHKVCEGHSKTAKVIVNGIEQRFCQQCSRFHLLSEFDDGKRSCRKRLAGHNERRRKPQVGIHSGRAGRLLQAYNGFAGGPIPGNTLTTTSFICQDILPTDLLQPNKYVTSDWCKRIKTEDGTGYNPMATIPITSGYLHSKSHFPACDFEKPYPQFHENGSHVATGSIFSENSTRYSHDFGGTNSTPRPMFQDTPLGSEDFNIFDTASTIQGLSRISDSGCALSLLSSQSQNSSGHSSGIPTARPAIIPNSHLTYSMSQVSEKLLGVSSQALIGGVSKKFSSSGMNTTEGSRMCPALTPDSDAASFGVTRIFQGSEFVNNKDRLSGGDHGPTIDLLQLSSQLQRVEQQRQSMQVKQENDTFCCLRIT